MTALPTSNWTPRQRLPAWERDPEILALLGPRPRKGRGPTTFKQTDIARAVKAVRMCGLDVVRTEIDREGKIVIVHRAENAPEPVNALDAWKAKRDARPA